MKRPGEGRFSLLNAIGWLTAAVLWLGNVPVLAQTPTDTSFSGLPVDSLYKLANQIRLNDPERALVVADTIVGRFTHKNPTPEELEFVFGAGDLFRRLSRFDRSREIMQQFDHLLGQPEYAKMRAYKWQVLGITDNQQGLYQDAIDKFMTSMAIYDSLGNLRNKAVLLREIGIIHERIKLNDRALEYGKESLAIVRTLGDTLLLASFLGDVGVMHQNSDKPQEALPYQLESLAIYEKMGDEADLAFTRHNIGDIYLKLGRLELAESYTQLALEGFERHGYRFQAVYSMMNIGKIAMERGQYGPAISYFNRALERAREFGGRYEESMMLGLLSDANQRRGDYRQAYDYLRQSTVMRDSIFTADRDRMIAETTERYQNAQIRNENERLRATEEMNAERIRMQRMLLAAVSLAVIALVAGLVLVIRANRHTRRLNTALVDANVRLQNIDQMREDLMHVMAHDLKTPLSQVKGLTDLMKGTEGTTEEHMEYLRLIDSATSNGLGLIDQIMTSNDITEEDIEDMILNTVNLKETVMKSMSLYEAQAARKELTIRLSDQTTDGQLRTHEEYLRRILDNLISNAIKYTLPKTAIRIQLDEDPEQVFVRVQDEGPGFSEEDRKLLFRKFTRLSAQPTGDEPSSGLGLAIVHDLVQTLGGDIYLEDPAGKRGAHFCLRLPKG